MTVCQSKFAIEENNGFKGSIQIINDENLYATIPKVKGTTKNGKVQFERVTVTRGMRLQTRNEDKACIQNLKQRFIMEWKMEAVEELKYILHTQWSSSIDKTKLETNVIGRKRMQDDSSGVNLIKVKPKVNINGIYNRMNKCLKQNDELLEPMLRRWENKLK